MKNLFLLAFAGFCLAIALSIAWVLGITLFYPKGDLANLLVTRSDIIRAHIDYLMMSQFLLIFFLLFRQQSINPPFWIVGACCYGAFFNPLSFLVRGLTPKTLASESLAIEPHFPLLAGVSFTLTTIGFLGSIVLVVIAAWKNRSSAGHPADSQQLQ
jgi:hypothetical protein